MKRILRTYRRHKRPKTQDSPDLVVFKPRQVRKDNRDRQRASLEDVPVEIQQIILHQMPDFTTLQALISASPCYLRAYRSQRHSVMSDVLHRSIHPDVLFDAMAVVEALKLSRNYDDYVPNLKAFVEQYKTTRVLMDSGVEPIEPSPMVNLWQFHLSVIDVTQDFCDHVLSSHPVTGQSLDHYTSLSPNEVRRIHRAFYRYELFTRLFQEPDFYLEEQRKRSRDRNWGRTSLALQRNSKRSLDAQDRSFLLLAIFKPWEVEEIACVRDHIMRRYDELYSVCKSELQRAMEEQNHPDTAPWDTPPQSPFEVYDDESCHEHYLSLGLSFFHTFIRASHEDRLTLLRENMGISYSSLSRALEEDGPDWDNPMYDAWLNEAPLGFDRDNDKNSPNAAWPWSTRNKVELRYYQSHTESLRKWGYVMWDIDRLDRWSILQENPDDYFDK